MALVAASRLARSAASRCASRPSSSAWPRVQKPNASKASLSATLGHGAPHRREDEEEEEETERERERGGREREVPSTPTYGSARPAARGWNPLQGVPGARMRGEGERRGASGAERKACDSCAPQGPRRLEGRVPHRASRRPRTHPAPRGRTWARTRRASSSACNPGPTRSSP